jgi:hypothetical protein
MKATKFEVHQQDSLEMSDMSDLKSMPNETNN